MSIDLPDLNNQPAFEDTTRTTVPLLIAPKTGDEQFKSGEIALGYRVLDFWRWSASDLVSNVTRGLLAEFIVAKALGVATESTVRDPWGAFDLTSPSGRKVEVKSAAFLQSWPQQKLSAIQFVARKTRALDPSTGEWSTEPKRQADVYIFRAAQPPKQTDSQSSGPGTVGVLCRVEALP